MINEELEITVPALVARAGMSTKTFYRHFSSRDELLLATMEDELAIGAHLVRREVDRHEDPVERLRACVIAYVRLPGRYRSASLRRARVREGRRLMALYEEQANQANAPFLAVFLDVITGLVNAGLIEVEDPDLTARSIFHVLNGHLADAAAEGSPSAYGRIGAHAWQFCCRGLGLGPEETT